jgi:predicted secreted protein
MSEITLEQAQAAKQSALQRFQTIGKIVGVGITRIDGEYAVKVNLSEPIEPGTEVPLEIEGVRVRIEVAGVIRARDGSVMEQ